MACKAIQMWTFSALVAAFLDLAIAYSLLCASTAAYLASKFLSVFGLSLPCPCDGLFGHINDSGKCVQRVLVDRPLQKISTLHASVRSSVPFESVIISCRNSGMSSPVDKKSIYESPDDGAASSSCSEKRSRHSFPKNIHDMHFRVSDPCMSKEGNAAEAQRQRLGLRRRRRGSLQYRRISSLSSLSPHDSGQIDSRCISFPLSTVSREYETSESSNDTQQECHPEASKDKETSKDIALQEKILTGFGSDKSIDNSRETSKEVSAVAGFPRHGSAEIGSSYSYRKRKNIIRALERALDEERISHANLCLELEKERNAAATAADEAMAMILRLQEEKASIEMEARQFQRAIEEKSAFDAEEMNIMMEILLRREKEKFFLEKEVEAYRQMIFADEQLDSDLKDTATTLVPGACLTPSSKEESELLLRRISKTFGEEESKKDASTPVVCEVTPINCRNRPSSFGELQVPAPGTQVTMSQNSPTVGEHDIHAKAMKRVGDEGEGSDNPIVGDDLGSSSEQPLGTPQISTSSTNMVAENDRKGIDICRSSSDMSAGFQLSIISQPENSPYNLRRKSMSAFDIERLKINSEVGCLRERLKFVQKGRQRLNVSSASPERGKTQLQLLEDIASQLRKIRRLRDPGKSERRRASLPPLSSKDVSKKRHWRSPSLEEHHRSS